MNDLAVIVPCYNKSEYVNTCLNSLLSQRYKSFEIIFVDDCSTDDSYNIAKKYEVLHTNLHVVRNPQNLGVSATRNNGAALAKTKYITFVDADDYYFDSEKLENEMVLCASHPNDVIFSNTIAVSSDGKTVLREYKYPSKISGKRLRDRNIISYKQIQCRDYIVLKEEFMRAGGYEINCSLFEDLDLLYRLSYSCDFYNTQHKGTAYRAVGNGLSSKSYQFLLDAEEKISKRYLVKCMPFKRLVLGTLRKLVSLTRHIIKGAS